MASFLLHLLGLLAFAQTPGDTDHASDTSAADAEASYNSTHFSAQTLQAMFLKGQLALMQLGKDSAKEATCLLSLWYAGDGSIRAVQLVKASGFPSIDRACLQSIIGRKLEGLPSEGTGGHSTFAIHWIIHPAQGVMPPPMQVKADPSIPQLTQGSLQLLASYPPDALAQHAQGICKMHITVSAAAAVSYVDVAQSTGSESLDAACRDAVNRSTFMAATKGGQPVAGTTDLAIVWRVPRR